MNKHTLINHWAYEKPIESLKIHDVLSKKLCDNYSKLNDLDLVNLNLLDESYNHYYWYICRKTGVLYYINLIIDNREFQLTKEIIPALSEVNRYVFIQINFYLQTNLNNSFQTINKFEINPSEIKKLKETLTYYLVNLSIEEKSVLNINKPSRSMRYLRRQILEDNRKRSFSDDEHEPILVKKIKKNTDDIWNEMVSATSIRNYMLNDPLIDWLKEYRIHDLDDIPSNTSNSRAIIKSNPDPFTKCIMDAGNEFEEELIKILNKDHKIVKVGDYILSRSPEKFQETIELMKKGEYIIHQAVLHNYEDKTFGMPDLLVRSDYINKLMGYQVISDIESKLGSPTLNVPWHYKVIDIKHSTIPLKADGIHILNSESIPAYKGQLYIYTKDLNKVQGIKLNKAYIWGKKYNWESKGIIINKFLNKLGVIDYDSIDCEYVNQTKNGIEWIKTMKNEGSNWSLLPLPCRKELFPNMKNEKDGEYRKLKNKLNDEIKEITSIFYCGIKNREKAHLQQIYKWTDPKCNSKVLGFNEKGKISNIVDCILDINRQKEDIIRPLLIKYDRQNWKTKNQDCIEFYLDFETLNSNFGSIIKEGIISYDNNQYIFMIGVGYENNGNWIYKTFIMKEKQELCELNMVNEFLKYISIILKDFNKNKAIFYHWSHAETTAYTNFKKRHLDNNFYDKNFTFYDLYKLFYNEPIVVKGALNFSLKSIAKALYNYNMIKSSWDSSSPCSNGLSAMILANEIYEKVSKKTIDNITDDPVMKEIVKYNEIDCKVMWEIHNLIREKL
jgi:hypothetical protein